MTSTVEELASITDTRSYINKYQPQSWAIFGDFTVALEALSKAKSCSVNSQLVFDTLLRHHSVLQRGHNITVQ